MSSCIYIFFLFIGTIFHYEDSIFLSSWKANLNTKLTMAELTVGNQDNLIVKDTGKTKKNLRMKKYFLKPSN